MTATRPNKQPQLTAAWLGALTNANNRPLVFSLMVHMLLVVLLIISGQFDKINITRPAPQQAETKPIINAQLVDQKAVAAAIARQEQAEKQRQQRIANEKKQAEKLKQEAKQAKVAAEKIKLEADAAKLKAKQELEKANKLKEQVAKVQQQTEQEKKKIEQAKQQAEETKRQLAQAKQQAEQAKQQQAEQQHQAQRQRWLDNEFNRFVASMTQDIYNSRSLATAFEQGLVCKIRLQLLPDGSVSMVRVVGSSGNPAYDAMAAAAVHKAAPFDMPADPEVVARLSDIILEFTDDF